MHAIAHVRSPWNEKFGVPRQPGLLDTITGTIQFAPGFRDPEMVRGLETYSHIWLVFQFHLNAAKGWSPTVRPPRLGGNRRLGVLATRSPFRPNPVGLSLVRLDAIRLTPHGPELDISSPDLVDGTPILDIKPYIPYADSPLAGDAIRAGIAPAPPAHRLTPDYAPGSREALSAQTSPEILSAIEETLSLDPRPAYHATSATLPADKTYHLKIHGFDVDWQIPSPGKFRVTGIREG